jgi:thiol-disulfide isomerase/thioredoxin
LKSFVKTAVYKIMRNIRFKTGLAIIALLFCIRANSQNKIVFNIDNYENDTLIIGNYLLDKQLVQDTLFANEEDQFVLQDSLHEGVYLVLTLPDNQFLQFLVNNDEPEFTMHFDYADKSNIRFEGSEDNTAFQYFVDFINEKRPLSDSLRVQISNSNETDIDVSGIQERLALLNAQLKAVQDSLIEVNPDFLSTIMIKANKEIVMPEFEATEDGRLAQYYYFKKHYFDYIDLKDPRALRSPFYFHRVNYYVDKLTPKSPDSIAQSIDSLLHWMGEDSEAYKYYLSHFLNSYAQTKIVGLDAVYVHIVDNYYGKGKAPWVEEENMLKILDRAAKLRPVLLGEIGEDIQVFQKDGTPVSISDIDYKYLVLLFWAPDCGHCKKSMPDFVDFNERYKDLGIKTFAICTKYRDKVKGCWESVEEKNMSGFINGADEFNRSNFKLKYYVDSTPKVYILDKDRKIIMKNIGGNQLDAVFEQILSREEKAASSNPEK